MSVAQVSDLDSEKNNNESIDISNEFNLIIPLLILDLGSRDIMAYAYKMKRVNKQCLLDTPRTVRVSEKTCQVIVQTSRP